MYRTTVGRVNVKRTVFAKDLAGQLSNLKWIIGGTSMHLDQALTKAAYDKLIADEAEYRWRFRQAATYMSDYNSNKGYSIGYRCRCSISWR